LVDDGFCFLLSLDHCLKPFKLGLEEADLIFQFNLLFAESRHLVEEFLVCLVESMLVINPMVVLFELLGHEVLILCESLESGLQDSDLLLQLFDLLLLVDSHLFLQDLGCLGALVVLGIHSKLFGFVEHLDVDLLNLLFQESILGFESSNNLRILVRFFGI